MSRGIPYAFVPNRLDIADRPELNVFPFNILFMQFKVENGKAITGHAVYEPDLGSYKREGDVSSMEYQNIFGPANWLVIEYDTSNQSYLGKKMVNGESAGIATGKDWHMFFIHFTALGLTNGEQCKFEEISPMVN